jgi:ribonuclease R
VGVWCWPTPPGYHFPYNAAKISNMGEHLSLTEINSQEAERESVKIKTLEYFERELARKTKTRFAAIITDVRPHGLFVELAESLTFGFVPAGTLPGDNYNLADDGTALVGRRHHRRFGLSDTLEVVIAKVDRIKRIIDFRAAD